MTLTWLYLAIGGALGSMGRYFVTTTIGQKIGTALPYGTMTVNVLGSFAMGALVAWLARHLPDNQQQLRILLATGFLGGFTTFSAFSLDVMTLYERGEGLMALGYALLTVVASVLALAFALYLFRPSLG